jgi:glutaredoxin-like protein NrdH
MSFSNVKLFALSTCSHCKDVKDFLNRREVDYECIEVDRLEGEQRTEAIAALKKYNSRLSFPTLIAGERVVVGNKQAEIAEALQQAEKEN